MKQVPCRAWQVCSLREVIILMSLTVAPTEDPTLSRMTLVTVGSDSVVEQITKQLNKLIDVVKVLDLSDGDHIECELMLVKVCCSR